MATGMVSGLLAEIMHGVLFLSRSKQETYVDSICKLNSTLPVPLSQQVTNIETQRQPNDTTAYECVAYQKCMCGGPFFSDRDRCLDCQHVHSSRSESKAQAFSPIVSSDSTCSALAP